VLYLLSECWRLMVVECKKRNITNTVQMEGYRNRTIVVNGGNKLMTCERITWGAWTSRYIKAGSFMFNPFTQSNVMLSWRRKFSFADVKLS